MLRISIELWPFGDESRKRILGEAFIANDASGDTDIGNYTVELMKSSEYAKSKGVWKHGTVKGFKRLAYGPWDLLHLCLNAALGAERINKIAKDVTIGGQDH